MTPSAWALARYDEIVNRALARGRSDGLDIMLSLDAAREEGHAERDHADHDARAEAAARVGLEWAGGNLPPTWHDIIEAARRDGAERMREAAAQAADNQAWADTAGKTWRDSAKHVARHIRALNPARVLAGEGDDGTG